MHLYAQVVSVAPAINSYEGVNVYTLVLLFTIVIVAVMTSGE
jgi:hypothetical protein